MLCSIQLRRKCSLTRKLFRPKQFSICPRRKQWLDRLLADIEAHYGPIEEL
jgi:hypothetical protein